MAHVFFIRLLYIKVQEKSENSHLFYLIIQNNTRGIQKLSYITINELIITHECPLVWSKISSSRKITLTYNLINIAMIVLPNNLDIIK